MTDKILKFSAAWCGPCKQLSMVLKGEDLGVPVEEVDIEANPELARQYGVRSVPTMVYVRNEQEVSRITGAQSLDKIRDWAIIQ